MESISILQKQQQMEESCVLEFGNPSLSKMGMRLILPDSVPLKISFGKNGENSDTPAIPFQSQATALCQATLLKPTHSRLPCSALAAHGL